MSPQIRIAEQNLLRRLERSFGPGLEGVVTFGHRVDPGTREETLRVVVDAATTPEMKLRLLPKVIDGFDVKVLRAGAPEF